MSVRGQALKPQEGERFHFYIAGRIGQGRPGASPWGDSKPQFPEGMCCCVAGDAGV